MIKISVIIPTFNREDFIENAIKSVLRQTYKVDEIIVIDNLSTDNTLVLIKDKYPQITVLKENKPGVSYARNKGILKAKNNWIALLDSDDEWLPNKIELQVEKIRSENSPLLIHTDEVWIKNGKLINKKKKHAKLEGYIFKESLQMCAISPSSVLINKLLFEKYGMFDFRLIVCEDYELWLRFTSKTSVHLVKEKCVIKYGGHKDQLSKKYWGMDRFRIAALENLLLEYNLSKIQKKEVLDILIYKINIILTGAKKRNNNTIIRLYNTKKDYWENKY